MINWIKRLFSHTEPRNDFSDTFQPKINTRSLAALKREQNKRKRAKEKQDTVTANLKAYNAITKIKHS